MRSMMLGAPPVKYSSDKATVSLVGSSLVEYLSASSLQALPPISNGLTVANWGQNAMAISWMRSNAATREETTYSPGKSNVLFFWGATNTIYYGATGEEAFSQLSAYISERKASHPDWKIIVATEIPRYEGTQSAVYTLNAKIEAYNALVRQNFRSIGASGLVDLQDATSPFKLLNYDYSSFQAVDSYWDAGTANYRVHISSLGYSAVVFPRLCAALRQTRK